MVAQVSRHSTSSPASALAQASFSAVTTPWVIDRLPAVIRHIARSPGRSQVNIFPKREMLSRPALVRVSDSITSPASSRSPTQ